EGPRVHIDLVAAHRPPVRPGASIGGYPAKPQRDDQEQEWSAPEPKAPAEPAESPRRGSGRSFDRAAHRSGAVPAEPGTRPRDRSRFQDEQRASIADRPQGARLR